MLRWNGEKVLSGTDAASSITLPAQGTVEISVCDYDQANQYGVVSVQADNPRSIVGNIVRIGAGDEYRFPTPLRE
jgi:hypothetical protein